MEIVLIHDESFSKCAFLFLRITSILNKVSDGSIKVFRLKHTKLTHRFANVWMFGVHKLSHTKSILREKGDSQYEKDALDASYDSCNLLL